jgi:hypothetical protein
LIIGLSTTYGGRFVCAALAATADEFAIVSV